jgi:hypothetical protein
MTPAFDLPAAAARLVADLMPIAVVVDGAEAERLTAALAEAGAGAELYAPGASGFDLAILLASPQQTAADAAPAVARLAEASDRLLFVKLPFGATELPDLDSWFELFAEQGFQPVVEYDASFLGQGAFLVDRNAIAAEAELASFVERVSMGGALAASTQRVAALEAELGDAGDRSRLKDALAQRDAALAARQTALDAARADSASWQARAAEAQAEADALRAELAAWQTVGRWVSALVAQFPRDALAELRKVRGTAPRRGVIARLRRRAAPPDRSERTLLADAALIRASGLFDPAWYIASQPDLAGSGLDPVWHYLLRGAAAGADPGPYFDSAAYRAEHPDIAEAPLAHALRHGAATRTPQ